MTSSKPVSYTHLDVYKRQGVDVKTENAIVELLRQLRAEGHLILVSTHKDVYKRQAMPPPKQLQVRCEKVI